MKKMLGELFNFRLFFKAMNEIEKDVYEEVYQCEVKANEQQTLLVSFREMIPHSMLLLVTVYKQGQAIPDWMYSLEITDKFIKQIDLHEYKTVTQLAEKIVKFSQTEFFIELIKTVPLPKDANKLFKTEQEKEALSPNMNQQ